LLPYPALLTIHLLAVMLFAGGLFLAALMMPSGTEPDPKRETEVRRLRRWNGWVTTPALVIVWAAGTAMAVEAGWFAARWLHLKLACVLLLTLLHGIQSWRLHRRRPPRRTRWPVAAASILLVAILYLVGAKPG
jgi:uncharacterized membrane protein